MLRADHETGRIYEKVVCPDRDAVSSCTDRIGGTLEEGKDVMYPYMRLSLPTG